MQDLSTVTRVYVDGPLFGFTDVVRLLRERVLLKGGARFAVLKSYALRGLPPDLRLLTRAVLNGRFRYTTTYGTPTAQGGEGCSRSVLHTAENLLGG